MHEYVGSSWSNLGEGMGPRRNSETFSSDLEFTIQRSFNPNVYVSRPLLLIHSSK